MSCHMRFVVGPATKLPECPDVEGTYLSLTIGPPYREKIRKEMIRTDSEIGPVAFSIPKKSGVELV